MVSCEPAQAKAKRGAICSRGPSSTICEGLIGVDAPISPDDQHSGSEDRSNDKLSLPFPIVTGGVFSHAADQNEDTLRQHKYIEIYMRIQRGMTSTREAQENGLELDQPSMIQPHYARTDKGMLRIATQAWRIQISPLSVS
jgi:hypothetical protein